MPCRIILANGGLYYPGDTINGKVVCIFSSRESFRGIWCKFRGREKTSWTKAENYYNSSQQKTETRYVKYTGDNKFLMSNIQLCDEGSLAAGNYEFPFSFRLPTGLPSPYSNKYGKIQYYIKVTVDKAFAFDIEETLSLDVASPVDLNEILDSLQLNPVMYEDEKVICCCCCASGPITLNAIFEKEVFVVGKPTKMKIEITNMSNESILGLSITLMQTVKSSTTHPHSSHKYKEELIAFMSDTGVGARGQRIYNIDFQIPPDALIPNFQGCTLFKSWYNLKIKAFLGDFHSDMKIISVVQVGHIPIESQTSSAALPQVPLPIPSVPTANISPPPYPSEGDTAPPYPTVPPSFPTPFEGSSNIANTPNQHFKYTDDPEELPPPSYTEIMRKEFSRSKAPSAPAQ